MGPGLSNLLPQPRPGRIQDLGRSDDSVQFVWAGAVWGTKAVSTPVPVANRTLAYWALESGLRPHELKIDRPRPVLAQLN